MRINKFLTFLLFLTVYFIILQDSVIKVGFQILYLAPIFIIFSLTLIFLCNTKKYLRKFIYLYKYTPIKYLLYFVLFTYITAFLHGNISTGLYIFYRITLIFGIVAIPTVLFATFTIPQKLSHNRIINILAYSSFAILLYGVLDFICRVIFKVEPPLRYVLCSSAYFKNIKVAHYGYSAEFLERASSIFFEPSFFATFIFVFIPLSCVLYKSKIKIINNYILDKLFKTTLLLLFVLCIFFTKSPIYIIFCLIYLLIYVLKNFFNKKNIIILSIILCTLFSISIRTHFILTEISSNNPTMQRLIKINRSIGSLESLTKADNSFATRIIAIVNTFQAFKNVPFIGCGYNNTIDIMYKQYKTTKTPLTKEILYGVFVNQTTGAANNIFFSLLLQTGIIGTTLLYLFFIKSIIIANKFKKFYHGKSRLLLEIIILIAINYVITSFYWSIETYPMMWFIFGTLNSYILQYIRFKNAQIRSVKNGLSNK